MRSRAQSPEHAETVNRRLRLLSAELSGIRPRPDGSVEGPNGAADLDEPHTHLRELRPVGGLGHVDPRTGELQPETMIPGEERLGPAPFGAEAEAESESESGAGAGALAPRLPTGGRHAARRGRSTGWLDLSAFRGRVTLTPSAMAVLAIVIAVGMAVTAWWVIRDDPGVPVAAPSAGPSLTTPVASAGVPDPGGSGSTEVVVDVAGKVRDPGIVILPPGSRVVDAIKAAGGPRRGADLTGLNRARPLQDGEQIVVGVPAPPGVAASSAPSSTGSSGSTTSELVSLNTATTTELEALPGVGPVTASAIVAWREANGGFANVDQLLEIDGIGEKTLAQLAPHVTL